MSYLRGQIVDFTHLYFGKASAEREIASDRDRFLRTYLDRWNLPQQIRNHEKFLVLGPKGSGKSAAAYYVAFKWKQELGESAVFSKSVDFDELNRTQTPLYSLDKRLVSEEVSRLTDVAWKLFIGIRLLESLLTDQACSLGRDPQVLKFVESLRQAGLASDDYPQVLRRIRERKGSISIPIAFSRISGELASADSDSLSPGQLSDAILNLVEAADTENLHLLSIDGLDKAITEHEGYWRTLAALVRVGDAITRRLQLSQNQNVYLMIMCRSDVFRRIRFSDAPKIASDSGIQMEWGAEAQNPLDVLLWEYIAQKAEIDINHLLRLLPDYVEVGSGQKIYTPKYLLEFTRYTPRDMSLLFASIQSRANTNRPVSGIQVRAGADRFASGDLLNEIESEAVGLLPEKVVSRFEQLLSSFPSRIIDRDQFMQAIDQAELKDEISPIDLGEYLFLQGAIGNYKPASGYVQFYHRRNTAAFERRGPWILQTGLAYALNVPFSITRERS
jgi:hypothetical protein